MSKYRIPLKMCLFLLVIILLFNHCSSPVDNDIIYSFKMYYLEDDSISYDEADSMSIDELDLQTNPFLSDENIRRFEVLYLDDNPYQTYHIVLEDSVDANLSTEVRPFIIILNGNRHCIADYWPSHLSIMPLGNCMIRMSEHFLWLIPGPPSSTSMPIYEDIIEALEKLGIEIKYINIGEG